MILNPHEPAPDLDPGQHFTGHPHWRVVEMFGHGYYVALVQEREVLHIHPIGFNTQRDAERGAARLNARDDKLEAG